MKHYLFFAAVAVIPAVLALGATGCKKPVVTVDDAGDAGLVVEAAAPVVEDAGEEAAAPLATATATAAKTAAPTGGLYQGTYHCMGGMKVTQTGSNVSARMSPGSDTSYSIVTCTASGDKCEGNVTAYSKPKDKPVKAIETRKATLKRAANGDLTYKGEREVQPTFCRKE